MLEILFILTFVNTLLIIRLSTYESPIIGWNQEDIRKLEKRVSRLDNKK